MVERRQDLIVRDHAAADDRRRRSGVGRAALIAAPPQGLLPARRCLRAAALPAIDQRRRDLDRRPAVADRREHQQALLDAAPHDRRRPVAASGSMPPGLTMCSEATSPLPCTAPMCCGNRWPMRRSSGCRISPIARAFSTSSSSRITSQVGQRRGRADRVAGVGRGHRAGRIEVHDRRGRPITAEIGSPLEMPLPQQIRSGTTP